MARKRMGKRTGKAKHTALKSPFGSTATPIAQAMAKRGKKRR